MRNSFLAVLAVLAALSAPAASAQTTPDFVFNVPVRIQNAPGLNGQNVQVQCSVRVYSPSGTWLASPAAVQYVRVGPSGYSGTVRLELTLPPTAPRSGARDWSCQLGLRQALTPAGAVVDIAGGNVDLATERYTAVTGQAVASHNMSVQGTFAAR